MEEIKLAHVEVVYEEDPDHTDARAVLELRGSRFVGWGRARRNPDDPNVPVIGEELATARALSDLSHQLVIAAANALENRLGHTVNLVG